MPTSKPIAAAEVPRAGAAAAPAALRIMRKDTSGPEAWDRGVCLPFCLSCGNPAFYWGSRTCAARCWCCGRGVETNLGGGLPCAACVSLCGPCCVYRYAHAVRGAYGVDYGDYFGRGVRVRDSTTVPHPRNAMRFRDVDSVSCYPLSVLMLASVTTAVNTCSCEATFFQNRKHE